MWKTLIRTALGEKCSKALIMMRGPLEASQRNLLMPIFLYMIKRRRKILNYTIKTAAINNNYSDEVAQKHSNKN